MATTVKDIPKSYSHFTLNDIEQIFHLAINSRAYLFPQAQEVEISAYLQETLDKFVPLAKAINTEKARSEWIVAPVLGEFREMMERKISLFSGLELNVEPEQGLSGVCDFIVSLSPQQLYLTAPVIMIVEAKRDNIQSGLGQCAAMMLAARIFNERAGGAIKKIYGVVTTGAIWQFLKLEGQTLEVDTDEYYINAPRRLMGVLIDIANGF
jgi:hypothetical protein